MSEKYELTPVYDEASFEAIQDESDVSPEIAAAARVAGLDSADTLVFARQLETIRNKVYEKKYAELKGQQLIPTSYEGGPHTERLTFRFWDGVTLARIVGMHTTNIPLVSSSAREASIQFFDLANGYKHNIMELERAAAAGVALSTKDAMLARKGHEIAIDDAYSAGIREKGTYGLTNHPNVSVVSLPNGDWDDAATTGEQMLEDMNYLLTQQWDATEEIFMGDTFLMTSLAYRKIATKILNTAGGSMTVLEAFRKQNPGVLVTSWTKLKNKSADGTGGRMIVYKRDSEVLEFFMGHDFKILPASREVLDIVTPCTSRIGGLVVFHPAAISYADDQVL